MMDYYNYTRYELPWQYYNCTIIYINYGGLYGTLYT